ncbi:Cytochrome b5-like Heme/Steroid binding domain protein [Aspergillus parasiticus SU-1]|uniref:Cytochrome b5-like heme/steroid binding domain-containing protein n=3 Tax=Aspergillus subgen. Circumdati TaxID=2720871 RepID=A0A5N6DA85_ASPPA|nr:cytochrome b5-like heme/steroid binding domain-containing protein [Aspergillus parasiticus]KAE8318857.1 cytochrome b5-like heme/steroid binding domain-containing protein [Aspergillus transmontanensis]KJK62912.1 Cytochrome b5-like Heme/Steroid binding domain protein [Aspergillus parasiticus SU-1]
MSSLRQRQVPAAGTGNEPSTSKPTAQKTKSRNEKNGLSVLDIIRVVVTLIVASCGLSYYMTSSESVLWGYRPWFTRWPVLVRYLQGPLSLTPSELALYNGSDSTLPIYLAINGSVFDVSANPLVYGPGGHYNFFTGKDATRAFVTGCFQEDQTHDLRGVEEMFMPVDEEAELKTLSSGEKKIRREQDRRLARTSVQKQVAHWENFFRNHKKYFEVGKVVGLEVPEEQRELCQSAKQQRPKRSSLKKGN